MAPAQLQLPGAVAGTCEEVATVDDDGRRGATGSGGQAGVGGDLARLEADLRALRAQLATEVRTRAIVVVDDVGLARARLSAEPEGCRLVLLDSDGFERVHLVAGDAVGSVTVAAHQRSDDVLTQVQVAALDSDEAEGAYVGVELVDGGNSAGGFTLYSGASPRVWVDPDLA